MKFNYTTNTIEITTTEAKLASKYGSDKFNELQTMKLAEPSFKIEVVKPTAKKVDRFKGLTYAYMKEYIVAHDSESTIIKTFYDLCGLDEEGNKMAFAAALSYGEVKQWFLTTYPEIENFAQATRVNQIMEETKKKRAAQMAARKAS